MNTNQPASPEEPSLLDLLKSRLKFWERGKRIQIPEAPQPQKEKVTSEDGVAAIDPDEELRTTSSNIVDVASNPPSVKVIPPNRIPWFAFLALAFALLGQRAWEPASNRTAVPGLIFYGFALFFLAWATIRKEWILTRLPESFSGSDGLKVRRLPLGLAVLFSIAAFVMLGKNTFTPVNVTLWTLAIISIVWAFWVSPDEATPFWLKIKGILTRKSWQVTVTRWTLLVLVVSGVVIFFRVYHLGGVPSEPFSDHAEKLQDVYEISQGQTSIFFRRNTGREAIQMYLTLFVSWLFGTGLSFMSLKIGTTICGLVTLPYLYLLGKEYGSKRIGLLAVFFAGIAYWPNVISRVGLRFPLYPLFVAPVLYFLLRGLRTRNRNDMIISGLFLGFGLHGYNAFRVMPIIVVIAFGLYLLHAQSKGNRKQAVIWLAVLAVVSFVVFLPLARYWMDNPEIFNYRILTRITSAEKALPGPAVQIFLSNVWNGLRMFNWDNGEVWVHSVVYRPALDVVSGALLLIGVLLLGVRYIRQRNWQDLFLLLSIPLLQLPSTLALAFPSENPALNRASGAIVPAFLLVGMAVDGLFAGIETRTRRRTGLVLITVAGLTLGGISAIQNYDLVFRQYNNQFNQSSWNSSDMGLEIVNFENLYGTTDGIWIVPFPYWVDTRLPGVWAGIPNRDFAIWPDQFESTLSETGPKLFMVKDEDAVNLAALERLYPNAMVSLFDSGIEGHDFYTLFIPADNR
jgi:hypothetical protein